MSGKFADALGTSDLPCFCSEKAKQHEIVSTMNATYGADVTSVTTLAHLLTVDPILFDWGCLTYLQQPDPLLYPVSELVQEPADIAALAIFSIVSDRSPVWSLSDDGFCCRYSGALAVIFSIEAGNENSLSTNMATFLFTIQEQLRSNDLEPSVFALAYTFRLSTAHGIILFQGAFNGWCDRLRSCGSVGIFGENQIPYVTWPLLDDDLADDVPLALDIARYGFLLPVGMTLNCFTACLMHFNLAVKCNKG